MAQQEEGWPLGLQPLDMRAGLMRNGEFSGSISFSTLLTGSPSSLSGSSSGLDTESTGSFFHDKSITLGSLIGVSSILDLSGRSVKGTRAEPLSVKKTSYKSKTWFLFLCSRSVADDKNPPSLGHFLQEERKAANDCRRNQSSTVYELSETQSNSEPNLMFINGSVAPPSQSSSPWLRSDVGRRCKRNLAAHTNGCGVPVLFSCVCGKSTN